MKKTLFALLAALLLMLAVGLVGCDGGKDPSGNKTTVAVTDAPSVTPEFEQTEKPVEYIELFGGSGGSANVFATTVDAKNNSIVWNFKSSLEEKTGKKITLANNGTAEKDAEIIVGLFNSREESIQAFEETPYSGCTVKFMGNKLVVASYTDELLENALSAVLKAMVKTPSGAWGLPKDFAYSYDLTGVTETVPKYEMASGKRQNGYKTSADEFMITYTGGSQTEYVAYCRKLKAAGYTEYSSNVIGANNFSTYVTDTTTLHLIWFGSLRSFRLIIGPRGFLPETKTLVADVDYVKVAEPTVTQIDRAGASAGMLFIVQLEDGSYLVIDGGVNSAVDMQSLWKFLRNNKPESDAKPRVRWMFTHPHNDHMEMALTFLNTYSKQIELLGVTYNLPDVDSIKWASDYETGQDLAKNYASSLAATLSTKYPNTEIFVHHTGQVWNLPGVEIEFLHTEEDYFDKSCTSFNDRCSAWRMTFTSGKTFLVTGDCDTGPSDMMASLYGSYLKSDVLQANHHGQKGGSMSFYQYVDPSIVFWANTAERMKPENTSTPNIHAYAPSRWLLYNRTVKNGDYHSEETVSIDMDDLSVITLK